MDLHAAQIQGFFDVPVDHLYAAPVLNEHFLELGLTREKIVVVSPDEGSIKRASGHAKRLGGKLAIVDKRRANAMETTQENIIGGPIEGRVALMFDDLISTAGSICGAARLVHEAGAREIHVAATHGLLCGSGHRQYPGGSHHQRGGDQQHHAVGKEQLIPQIQVLSRGSACWPKPSSGFTTTSRSAPCFARRRPERGRWPQPIWLAIQCPKQGREGIPSYEHLPDVTEQHSRLRPGRPPDEAAAQLSLCGVPLRCPLLARGYSGGSRRNTATTSSTGTTNS